MGEFHCDRCGGGLLANEDVRYKVRIEVTSVYDVMEIRPRELAQRDFDKEFKNLIDAIGDRSAEDLEAEVYKSFQFDLCLPCQRAYIQNPLGLAPPEEPVEESHDPQDP